MSTTRNVSTNAIAIWSAVSCISGCQAERDSCAESLIISGTATPIAQSAAQLPIVHAEARFSAGTQLHRRVSGNRITNETAVRRRQYPRLVTPRVGRYHTRREREAARPPNGIFDTHTMCRILRGVPVQQAALREADATAGIHGEQVAAEGIPGVAL